MRGVHFVVLAPRRYKTTCQHSVMTDIKPLMAAYDVSKGICLEITGVLTIAAGYSWDGPSGPAIDTAEFMRASLYHDALYDLIGSGLLDASHRDDADRLMREICLMDGMSKTRAWYAYLAVRAFGGGYVGRKTRPRRDR